MLSAFRQLGRQTIGNSSRIIQQSLAQRHDVPAGFIFVARQPYHSDQAHEKIMRAFYSKPDLHFANEELFCKSDLYRRLEALFSQDYQLNPHLTRKFKTLSMRETLQKLRLDQLYQDQIEEDKYLIGIHGASILSAPQIIPYPVKIMAMQTSHNPYHTAHGPVWFFYGDNIGMALHYSLKNSVSTENTDGDSDPRHFPQRIGLLGFVSHDVIKQIQADKARHDTDASPDKTIITAETHAWERKGNSAPDEFVIGNEVRLPSFYHASAVNLPLFGMTGKQRATPLDEGIQYAQGRRCTWKKGEGFRDSETGELIKSEKSFTRFPK